MSDADIASPRRLTRTDRRTAIQRLLFVADAAVADVDELPPAVRAVIDGAAEVYVLTPTLPGRLAWLADEVDRYRHIADERLDTVLGHMHSIDAHVSGMAIRGSVLTVIADAVEEFRARPHPDRAARRGARQLAGAAADRTRREALRPAGDDLRGGPRTGTRRSLTARCSSATTDPRTPGTPSSARASCSPDRRALVVTVWQPTVAPGSLGFAGRDRRHGRLRRARSRGRRSTVRRVADEGVRIAQEAGLRAEPVAVEAAGPGLEDDRRDRRPRGRGDDRDGLSRTDGSARDAAGKRLQRRRAPRRPAHADHPALPRGGIGCRRDRCDARVDVARTPEPSC